ncbi:hypothetical protein KEM54_005625 [Ascosphaera aggregata]|nr:hypothetical protein KEM54_005625 [Ascosphaera aggregata]
MSPTTQPTAYRHVIAGHGDNAAIIWESPVTGATETWSYQVVLHEVEVLAGVLREEGVKKGDLVLLYMPMIPAALFATLAIGRLGAIHSIVFGGFASASLAKGIDSVRPQAIMTASCGIEGNKGPIPYKPLVECAIEMSSWKPPRTLMAADCQKFYVDTDGLLLSGTTGALKGIVREAGGHAVGLTTNIRQLADVNGPGDVMFCSSDIGWVVGHSYIIYGPLLVGATTIVYEGKPIGTPDAGIFWRIVQKHKATALYTAPTALRAIKKHDPELELVKPVAEKGGLRTLRDSAGKTFPGFDVRIVDDEGNELGAGGFGNIVLKTPLAPTAFTTLFNDDVRFYKGYIRRFWGKWFDTGDAGIIDKDGTGTEQLRRLYSIHPKIAEACVVGIPDSLKGHLPFAFIQLNAPKHHAIPATPPRELYLELNSIVREQIGAIASLGGIIQGQHMIPKKRSGKMLRRVLRELIENAVVGEFDKMVTSPPTIEDPKTVEIARANIKEYFARAHLRARL